MQQFKEPIDLIGNDQPNTCHFDGRRTSLLEQREDFTIECCPECGKLFNFWNDEEA